MTGADEKSPTQVMRLFRQWEQDRSNTIHLESEEECDRAFDRMSEIEKQMIALPSQNMADLAAKIIAYTCWGDFELPDHGSNLWTELKSLVSDA